MKTKKALAVLLAAVMLVVPMVVASYAAPSASIANGPIQTAYVDSERFNPQGLTLSYDGAPVVYTPTDADFRFVPGLDELLTVKTTEVIVYYKNQVAGVVPVTVDHILGELTIIDNGHGKYCLGCGELHEFEKHVVDEDAWVPNDDAGFFTNQTMRNTCLVCGDTVTQEVPNSDNFSKIFNTTDGSMSKVEVVIYEVFYKVVVAIIQMITGIN